MWYSYYIFNMKHPSLTLIVPSDTRDPGSSYAIVIRDFSFSCFPA